MQISGTSTVSRSRNKTVTTPGDEDANSGVTLLAMRQHPLTVSVSIKGLEPKNGFSARLDVKDRILRPAGGVNTGNNGNIISSSSGNNSSSSSCGNGGGGGGGTLILDKMMPIEDVAAPEPGWGSALTRQRMYLVSAPAETYLEQLLRSLFDRGVAALGTLSGVGTFPAPGPTMNIALYAVGRDRGLLVLQGWRERPAANPKRIDVAQVQVQTRKDRHRPASRSLLQLAANAQLEFGNGVQETSISQTLEGRDVEDSSSAWGGGGAPLSKPPYKPNDDRSVGGLETNALVAQQDVSFDFCVSSSGFDAGHSNLAFIASDTSGSVSAPSNGKPFGSGLFQSVMGAVAAAAGTQISPPSVSTPPSPPPISNSALAPSDIAAQPASIAVSATIPSGGVVGVGGAAVARTNPVVNAPSGPLLSSEEDVLCRARVQQSLHRFGKGEKAAKHKAFLPILESCFLSRSLCPAETSAALANAMFCPRQGQSARENKSRGSSISRELSAYRCVAACLQPLGDGGTRSNRGLGLSVATACVIRTLLALELIRHSERPSQQQENEQKQSTSERILEEMRRARQMVSNAIEKLMLMTRMGQLLGPDLTWLLHMPQDVNMKGCGSVGAGTDCNVVSTSIGEVPTGYMHGNTALSGSNSFTQIHDATAPSPAHTNGETFSGAPNSSVNASAGSSERSSLATFLAYCVRRFAGSSTCQSLLNDVAGDLGLANDDSTMTPSPTSSKRRLLMLGSSEADHRSSVVVKEKDISKRARVEATSTTLGSFSSSISSLTSTVHAEDSHAAARDKEGDPFHDVSSQKAVEGTAPDINNNDITMAATVCQTNSTSEILVPMRGIALKRTNSILSRAGMGSKAALSQRTNGALKRQVTIAAEKQPSKLPRQTSSMPPPPPAQTLHKHGYAHSNRYDHKTADLASSPLPSQHGGRAIILDTPLAAPHHRGGTVEGGASNQGHAGTSYMMQGCRDNLSSDIGATSHSQLRAPVQTPRPPRQKGVDTGGVGSALQRRVGVGISRGMGALGAAADTIASTPVGSHRSDHIKHMRAVVADTPLGSIVPRISYESAQNRSSSLTRSIHMGNRRMRSASSGGSPSTLSISNSYSASELLYSRAPAPCLLTTETKGASTAVLGRNVVSASPSDENNNNSEKKK